MPLRVTFDTTGFHGCRFLLAVVGIPEHWTLPFLNDLLSLCGTLRDVGLPINRKCRTAIVEYTEVTGAYFAMRILDGMFVGEGPEDVLTVRVEENGSTRKLLSTWLAERCSDVMKHSSSHETFTAEQAEKHLLAALGKTKAAAASLAEAGPKLDESVDQDLVLDDEHSFEDLAEFFLSGSKIMKKDPQLITSNFSKSFFSQGTVSSVPQVPTEPTDHTNITTTSFTKLHASQDNVNQTNNNISDKVRSIILPAGFYGTSASRLYSVPPEKITLIEDIKMAQAQELSLLLNETRQSDIFTAQCELELDAVDRSVHTQEMTEKFHLAAKSLSHLAIDSYFSRELGFVPEVIQEYMLATVDFSTDSLYNKSIDLARLRKSCTLTNIVRPFVEALASTSLGESCQIFVSYVMRLINLAHTPQTLQQRLQQFLISETNHFVKQLWGLLVYLSELVKGSCIKDQLLDLETTITKQQIKISGLSSEIEKLSQHKEQLEQYYSNALSELQIATDLELRQLHTNLDNYNTSIYATSEQQKQVLSRLKHENLNLKDKILVLQRRIVCIENELGLKESL